MRFRDDDERSSADRVQAGILALRLVTLAGPGRGAPDAGYSASGQVGGVSGARLCRHQRAMTRLAMSAAGW
jgi:hypothetical protein